MNKKFYLGALALPLIMAACSSEDTLSEVQGVKDQYEGIAKVDATFAFEGTQSRLAKEWNLEEGDKIGMAWLGVPEDEKYGVNYLSGMGWAYQNHPLKATGTGTLKPETSIYVGKYFIYYPYDAKTQQLKNIQFNLGTQPLSEEYKDAAINSLWLSSELTDVTIDGDINENNKAGEACTFTVKARQLSNAVGLEATWLNNDIIEAEISAPVIDSIMVGYSVNGQVVSATGLEYAPKDFENGFSSEYETYNSEGTTNTGRYWGHFNLFPSEKPESRVAAEVKRDFELLQPGIPATGFENIQRGLIKLAKEGGYTVQGESAKFYYNALPATTTAEDITMRVLTDFGVIDYTLPMNEAAMTVDYRKDNATGYMEGFDGPLTLVGSENGVEITTVPADGSFMNRLFKSGKILANINFFDAKINGMHVKDDAHLQKLLKFFKLKIANGNTTETTDVVLYLDAKNGDFEISKESVAMLQEINAEKNNVVLKKCNTPADHTGTPRIVLFNNGTDLEVPSLYKVFGQKVEVFLKDQTWTWGGTASRAAAVKQMGNVTTLHNLGTLNVNGDMNYASKNDKAFTIENKKQINVNVKMEANININNHATIDVKDEAEFWAGNGYILINLAESLTEFGTINNEGVITVTEKATPSRVAETVAETEGQIINYGLINHNSSAANKNVKTYITSNQTGDASFTSPFAKDENMFGTIMLKNKFDNVSVSNFTEEGFIKYAWNAEEDSEDEENVYQTPVSTYYKVKYNYLIVDENIKFVEEEAEIKFIEIAEGKEVIIAAEKIGDYLGLELKGLVLAEGAEANIQLQNTVDVEGAFVKNGILRVGGEFFYDTLATYLGGSAEDHKNIGKY